VILQRAFAALGLGGLLLLLSSGSCVPEPPERGRSSTTGEAHGSARRPPAVDLVGEATWPAPYASDPLWQRASIGNDIDHARLAQRESALSLVAALRHGGSLGRTALRALEHVLDRHEARGQLCELVPGQNAMTASSLLDALYGSVVDGPLTEESMDAEADARCARALRELMRQGTLSAADRDRLEGTLTRLEAH
jgi:hypothetical protein